MYFSYKKATGLLLVVLQLFSLTLRAQNLPNTETAPAGTVTNFTAPPEPQLSVINSIQVYQPQVPITDPALVTGSNPGQVRRSVIVKDGFQRTVQTIQTYQSRVGGVYKNLVGIADNRVQAENTSYLPYTVNSDQAIVRESPFAEQKAYYNGLYPSEGYTSFSKERVFSDANTRQVQGLAPGKSQVGQGRATVVTQTTNSGNEVRIWGLDAAGKPVSTASYAPGELFGTLSQSPAAVGSPAPFVLSYTNKSGRVVMTKETDTAYTSFDQAAQKSAYNYRITYYVYDDMGRLRYTIPPKAVLTAESNAWTIVQTVIDNLCFQYRYDDKGRLNEQRSPGENGFTAMVYDHKQRVVMTQSPDDKAMNHYQLTYYDKLDRIIATALYTDYSSPTEWQTTFDYPPTTSWLASDIRHYMGFNKEGVIPGDNSIAGHLFQTYNFYDGYEITDPGNSLYTNYNNQLQFGGDLLTSGTAETPVRSFRTRGLPTGSKIRILPSPSADPVSTGNWSWVHHYYDDKGRQINNLKLDFFGQGNMLHFDYSGTQYDFVNRPLLSKRIFQNLYATSTINAVLEKNTYEPVTGQLTQTDRKFGTGGWHTTGSYLYDDMGRVQQHMIGLNGEYQDFSYNMRGQLTGINAIFTETANKGGRPITFGEKLYYDYGFSQPRYDGKIAGMQWRGTLEKYAYGYSYDLSGRLKAAEFRVKRASWTKLYFDYTVSNLNYDKNGNLLTMNQRGMNVANLMPVDMDLLNYTYEDGGISNRLYSVTDNANNYDLGDFVNTNGAGMDYSYTDNGFLKSDANKGISNISYTYFNKPEVVTFSNGKSIEYSYDAMGTKVQELIKEPGKANKQTDYLGGYIYENHVLQYLLTAEGRVVRDPATETFKEEYFVKDHLGNVHSTIDITDKPLKEYLATYEIASANLEGMLFDGLSEIREDKPNSTNPEDVKSGRLNGTDPSRRTGTSLLMHVMAEDQVDINVNNFYENYDKDQDNPVNAEDMLESLVSTLTGGTGGFIGSESHNPDFVQQLFGPDNYMNVYEGIVNASTDASRPKAYLNYILFDEGMRLVPEFSKSVQVNGNGSWQTIGTNGAVTIPVNGYLAVYLSTRSQTVSCVPCSDVYFDQLSIKVQKGRLLEETYYYPHGLPWKAFSTDAALHTKAQRHKYQGNEYIKDLGLNWMDFHARQYDPQLGRFLGVDPKADAGGQERLSPYAAMGNAPESMVDPNGEQSRVGIPNLIEKGYGNSPETGGDASRTIADVSDPMGGFGRGDGGGSLNRGSSSDIQTVTGRNAAVAFLIITGQLPVVQGLGSEKTPVPLEETTITPTETNELNVVQAAALDIGRNDYNRWKVNNFSKIVVGWTGIGAIAPFVIAAGLSAAPAVVTSFLSNPATWTEVGGAIVMGAHGYESELPSAGALKSVPTGAQYSVAFETELANNLYPGKGYYTHFKAANVSLSNAMASDEVFSASISKMGISIPRSPTGNILGNSPKNWVWHHSIEQGIMQLVPKTQHTTGSIYWKTMHPNGVGGMSTWGK